MSRLSEIAAASGLVRRCSTREIVADNIGGQWDTKISHGPRKLGHNPSWVKAADYDRLREENERLNGDVRGLLDACHREEDRVARLEAAIEVRRGENEQLEATAMTFREMLSTQSRELTLLRGERDRLKADFLMFGQHTPICGGGDGDRCDCEYTQSWKACLAVESST